MEEEPRGAALHMSSEDGRRLCITGMSLADPASLRGERVVNVWAEVVGAGQEKRAIGTLSSKDPAVSVSSPVVLAGEFVLRHDLAVPAAVRLNVRVLGPPESDSNVEEVKAVLVLGVDDDDVEEVVVAAEEEDGEEEEIAGVGVEYEPMSEEDVAERYDSDTGDEDDDSARDRDERRNRLVAAPGAPAGRSVVAVPDGEFIGPARFAVVGNTAGVMRIAAAAVGDEESREIIVLYRYTRFSSGWRGVEACRRTKLHRLRFAVPPPAAASGGGGDMASALAWAGSALGPLIYPGLFRQQLADLWTNLLAAAPAAIPPRAGRVQVIVDAGILRREDYTAERMADMRGEVVTRAVMEPWPAWCYHYHVVMELHLPEPVPASRTRIAAGDEEEEEECSVCFEVLEPGGMAAWPGCGHVFHGACVEKTLRRSEMCPLCRHRLSGPLVRPERRQAISISSAV